jgi:predicted MFS family arabinose efflux permease
VPTIIAPQLLAEFGWSRSEFALVSTLGLASSAAMPFIGRTADLIGARLTALIGIVSLPIAFVLSAMMTGPIWQYLVLYAFMAIFAITTTSVVYTRVPVQYVNHARGLALAIIAAGPAITGAIGTPFLNSFVETQGWRAGYLALAAFSAIAGLITFIIMPKEKPEPDRPKVKRRARDDYPMIFRSPAFWILFIAMLLCNSPQVIALSQMKLLLMDNGITAQGTSLMISAYAVGTLAGRFLAGFALDRIGPHIVALVCMGLPSVGLLVLATPFDAPVVLTAAIFLMGFSIGAESDIAAYIVSRLFSVEIYSSVYGLIAIALSTAAVGGAAVLSLTLDTTGGYDLFLVLCAAAVATGSLMFLLLGRKRGPMADESAAMAPASLRPK